MLPQTACGVRCGDLELDLEKVKGVHAQRGSNSCPETCDCMVLIQVAFVIYMGVELCCRLTKAVVGKKLAGCCFIPAIAGL